MNNRKAKLLRRSAREIVKQKPMFDERKIYRYLKDVHGNDRKPRGDNKNGWSVEHRGVTARFTHEFRGGYVNLSYIFEYAGETYGNGARHRKIDNQIVSAFEAEFRQRVDGLEAKQ